MTELDLNKLADKLLERAGALGWRNDKGKWTRKGKDGALDYLIGAATAAEIAGIDPNGLNFIIWLGATRDDAPGEFLRAVSARPLGDDQ